MSERSAGGRDMPLRIGFDLDGTLADFASAFRDIELSLFGTLCQGTPEQPEANEARLATAPHSHPVDTRSAAADAEAVHNFLSSGGSSATGWAAGLGEWTSKVPRPENLHVPGATLNFK